MCHMSVKNGIALFELDYWGKVDIVSLLMGTYTKNLVGFIGYMHLKTHPKNPPELSPVLVSCFANNEMFDYS